MNDTNALSGAFSFYIWRYFSIMTLAAILVSILTLYLLHRWMVIDSITEIGEGGNLILAHTTLDNMRPELADFLSRESDVDESGVTNLPVLGPPLERALRDLLKNTGVARIKIYNPKGTVVFSTKTGQIGKNQQDNPAFVAALGGVTASKLIYHDDLTFFTEATEEDNLVQTYLPVRRSSTDPILGVFEIYTDVSDLVFGAERHQLLVGLLIVIVLLLLYAALLFAVRHAALIIDRQQRLIRDRTQSLEILSAQLLTAQEDEKKRLAEYLHEDVAQTLSAIKLHVEDAFHSSFENGAEEHSETKKKLVAIIQDAIQKIRSTAMQLHPSSLDDLGLVSTVGWFVRNLQSFYPDLRVELHLDEAGDDIPQALKAIIFRIVQEALNEIGNRGQADVADVTLRKTGDKTSLVIEDNGTAYHAAGIAGAAATDTDTTLSSLKELTILSGGIFSTESNGQGGTINRASWPATT